MVEHLTKLYNTLRLIETRGDSTKAMAKCLEYIESLVDELRKSSGPTDNAVERSEAE